jgi:hypothetical protein
MRGFGLKFGVHARLHSVYRYPGTVAPAVELPNSGCIKSLLDLLTSVDVFSLSRSQVVWVGASRLGPSCLLSRSCVSVYGVAYQWPAVPP